MSLFPFSQPLHLCWPVARTLAATLATLLSKSAFKRHCFAVKPQSHSAICTAKLPMETPSEVDTTVGNDAVENESENTLLNSTQACNHFGALWSDEAGTKSGCNTFGHPGSILQDTARFLHAPFFPAFLKCHATVHAK